jgi:HEAT repeat protein
MHRLLLSLLLIGLILFQPFVALAQRPQKKKDSSRKWTEVEAHRRFIEADRTLLEESHPPESQETIETWITALDRLRQLGSRAALPAVFDWIRKKIQSSPQRDMQWQAAIDIINRTAESRDAGLILELWKQTDNQPAAYDLAWILGNLKATAELASQLDHAEAWRSEQVALILYGHSEQLNLEQAGKILKTRQLCRFQQLWLITRVVKAAHPSAEELAKFLALHEVIPSPELLYELRSVNSDIVAAMVRKQLTIADAQDRARLVTMLPDFELPDRETLAQASLTDKEPEVRAAAIIALSRINLEAAYSAAELLGEDRDIRVARALQQSLGISATPEQMARLLHRFINDDLTDDEIQTAVDWIGELGVARNIRVAEPLKKVLARASHINLRIAAAEAIGMIGRSEDAPAIRAAVEKETDSTVRTTAIEALGFTGSDEDIERLKPFLYQPVYSNSAALALSHLKLSSEDVVALLSTLPMAVRETDASDFFGALTLCCNADSIPQIISAALMVDNKKETDSAARTLAILDRSQSIRMLQAVAVSGTEDAREAAIRMLISLPLRDSSSLDTYINALSFDSSSVQRAALFGIGILRDRRAIAPLNEYLKKQKVNNDNDLQRLAIEALLLAEPESLILDKKLASSDRENQLLSLYSLSRVSESSKIEARRQLKKMFSSYKYENDWPRFAAAAALVRMGDSKAIEFLIDSAGKNRDPYLSAAMLYVLGNLPDGGQSKLRPYLEDPKQNNIRPFGNLMLALQGDREASKKLLENLSSDNRRNDYGELMTAFEILTLGAKPTPGVVESLLNIVNQGELGENFNFLSGAAVMALGDLRDARALPALRRARLSIDPLIAFYAASAMYKLADTDWTMQLLESNSPELVRTGIYISPRFQDSSITRKLVKALSHGDWQVRGYAAFTLGRRLAGKERSAEAVRKLTEIAATDYSLRVRDEAKAALRHMSDPSTVEGTYFEAGLLLDWVGKSKTGIDELLPLAELKGTGLQGLRSMARGDFSLPDYYEDYDSYEDNSIIMNLFSDFLNRSLALHLLGEARAYDAFALTEKWAAEKTLDGTFFEEAQYGALAVLVAEMGDPRGLTLLHNARGKTREWLVRSLIDIGIEKLSAQGLKNNFASLQPANIAAEKKRERETKSVMAEEVKYVLADPEEAAGVLGGWGSSSTLNARLNIRFQDLRRGKTYVGRGRLLWEGFDRLRLKVSSPIGITMADLAIKDTTMDLAIYLPASERRLLRGTLGTLQEPSAEFVKRAGAFSALRPEHLMAALRIPDSNYISNSENNDGHLAFLRRKGAKWRLSEREWRDAQGRLIMRVSYRKPFNTIGSNGIVIWAEEVIIERPEDGYLLKLYFSTGEMKIGEKLPDNAFNLNVDRDLPLVILKN